MVSMKDIANEVHLSVSVISRVLNPRPDANARVSAETRRLVQAAAERLGYRRNRLGEFLRKGRSAVIGVFIPSYSNSLIADLLLGISEAANDAGFPISVYAGHTRESYQKFIARQEQSSACGMITYSQLQYDYPELDELMVTYHERGGKMLVLNDLREKRFPVLAMDEYAGGKIAAGMLLDHGIEEIFVLEKSRKHYAGVQEQRLEGLQQEASCRGVPVSSLETPVLISWLKAHPGRGGVYGLSDLRAIEFMNRAAEEGLRAGRDYYLCGYDDLDAASCVSPPLSTVHQPFREEGRLAVESLVRLIDKEHFDNQLIQPAAVRRATA